MARQETQAEMDERANSCVDCEDPDGPDELARCLESKRPCGHHCNHSWTHDRCCWCDTHFGDTFAAMGGGHGVRAA